MMETMVKAMQGIRQDIGQLTASMSRSESQASFLLLVQSSFRNFAYLGICLTASSRVFCAGGVSDGARLAGSWRWGCADVSVCAGVVSDCAGFCATCFSSSYLAS
ncbi:uncharacterized protein LOC122723107 [Manihot esculenta]|uniref:uncharacterized protein LOC122723107 n=1 Tax=Manihot esculenta TaxID=3983 RepID=UPI001CC368F6|nr:uncharacterized protein LOC122723107 [Manihot esculenta]